MDKRHQIRTMTLSDGTRVRVRSIRPDDTQRLQAFVARCSPRTIFLRTNMVRSATLTDREAAYLTDVDYRSNMALVALVGAEPHEQIVGVARYAGSQPVSGEAEAAIIVEDAYQGRGLGCQLLAHLAAYARDEGVSSLVGNISLHNASVLALIRRTGLAAEYLDEGCGDCRVRVSLAQRMPGAARGTVNLPARVVGRVGRSLQWHLDLAAQLVTLRRRA